MKKTVAQFVLLSRRIKREHLQLLLVILTLAMLVLGVGAPADGGGPYRSLLSSGL